MIASAVHSDVFNLKLRTNTCIHKLVHSTCHIGLCLETWVLKLKKVKDAYWNYSYEETSGMFVTCQPTRINATRFNHSRLPYLGRIQEIHANAHETRESL